MQCNEEFKSRKRMHWWALFAAAKSFMSVSKSWPKRLAFKEVQHFGKLEESKVHILKFIPVTWLWTLLILTHSIDSIACFVGASVWSLLWMPWSCWECVELCHLSTGTITCIQSEDTHSTPSAMDLTWQPTCTAKSLPCWWQSSVVRTIRTLSRRAPARWETTCESFPPCLLRIETNLGAWLKAPEGLPIFNKCFSLHLNFSLYSVSCHAAHSASKSSRELECARVAMQNCMAGRCTTPER